MTVHRIPITSDTQWHGLRARNVGASEAAALLGVHDYLTPLQLWGRKTGALEPEPESGPMKRGRKLEPVAAEMIADEFPRWTVERPGAYFTDDELRLGATPDLFATDPAFGLGIVQIKCVEPGVFSRTWIEDGTIRPPLWIAVQALVEMHLTGAQWAAVAALVVSYGIDLHVVNVPLDDADGVIQRVRDETAHFWHLIDTGRRPDPDFGRDLMVLRKLLGVDDGSEIDLSGDNEVPTLIARRQDANDQIKASQAVVETCNAMLLNKLGLAQIGRFNGGYITGKTTDRKAYSVAATRYRALRIKLFDQKDDAA